MVVRVLLVAVVGFAVSGCAVGYMDIPEKEAYDFNIVKMTGCESNSSICLKTQNIKITHNSDGNIFRQAFERTLRSEWHILDIRHTTDTSKKESGRVLVSVEDGFRYPGKLTEWWLGFHVLTFATIPSVTDGIYFRNFLVTLPDGRHQEYRYEYEVTAYSWLPFLFFAPGFIASISGGDDYGGEYVDAESNIVNDFLIDAMPFILSAGST